VNNVSAKSGVETSNRFGIGSFKIAYFLYSCEALVGTYSSIINTGGLAYDMIMGKKKEEVAIVEKAGKK
jgi:hypothetical protein